MKTISTLLLTGLFALSCGTASAQSWTPGGAPHKHSKYYNGYGGMDYSHRSGNGSHYGRYPDYGFGSFDRLLDTRCPVSLQAGFVTKRFGTYFGPGDRFHENLWGEQSRFMNGMQMGIAFQPTAYNGLGFRTGGFYELYFASGNGVREMGYNRFVEHDLYFPFDFAYNFRPAPGVDINLTTGLGFNVAMAGVYRSWGRNGTVEYQEYGNYNRPDRINAMWEFGAQVRYDHLQVGLGYGLGLNDHEFYDNARTRQNKLTVSVAAVF